LREQGRHCETFAVVLSPAFLRLPAAGGRNQCRALPRKIP
jgi:hypothetical protein